ncbi:MAG: hypothetical protein ABEJ78_08560 [Haloferacaceae archaeon]
MKAEHPDSDAHLERCERCGRQTPHTVSIEIRTENPTTSNAAFSREPYRVSVCGICDDETVTRMNDA